MIEIENHISTLIEDHFPSFYNEEGPLFILFTKEYFSWLEKHYVYLTLENSENFLLNDTVTQTLNDGTIVSGVIENVTGKNLFVRMVSGEFRCNTRCLNDVTEVFSSSGGKSFVSNIQSTNFLYYSRNLLNIRDLDKTNSRFYVYFKEKYLKNIQFDTESSQKLLIKAAHELYSSKGTERSIDLLFKLVFSEPAKVFYPGEYVMKVSSGSWTKPTYLEISRTPRSLGYVNKTITGVTSGAEAFCNYITTRNIKGKLIDVMYISNIRGNFITGEPIVDSNTEIVGAPIVIGSMTNIDVTAGGQDFEIGEEVLVKSNRGLNGKAIVSNTVSETGIVKFGLVDGGWGYSNTSNSLLVSDKVLQIKDVSNANNQITGFFNFEVINQDLVEMEIASMVGNGTSINSSDVVGKYVTSAANSLGLVCRVLSPPDANNKGLFVINKIEGDITSNNFIRFTNNIFITTQSNTSTSNSFFVGETIRQSNGTSNVSSATIFNISNTITFNVNTASITGTGIKAGFFALQSGTQARGYVVGIPANTNNNFDAVSKVAIIPISGVFNGTSNITLYNDEEFTTTETTFFPTSVLDTITIKVNNASGSRWYAGNTMYGQLSSEVSSVVMVSDVGGLRSNTTVVTATANVIASNTTHIGLIDLTNSFLATPGNKIYGQFSNTWASVETIYTGTGAGADIFQLVDTEDVRINTDLIKAFNIGPTSLDVRFYNIDLTGANSTFGYMVDVLIVDPGTGYSNTDKIVFSGGLGGNLSYSAANATITTDGNGSIVEVILNANAGGGYAFNPNVSIVSSSGGSTSGSNANLVPLFPYGFPKYIRGTLNSKLVELLTFQNKTIGTIASLTNINPGENYNIKPFVVPYEPYIADFGKMDYLLQIDNLNRGFAVGELAVQTLGDVGVQLTCNLVSGPTTLQTREFIYTTDGINIVASGERYSVVSNSATNNYVIILANTTGTFQNTINTSLLQVNRAGNFNINDTVSQGSGMNPATGVVLGKNSTHIVVKNVFAPNGSFAISGPALISSSGGNSAVLSANNNYQSFLVYGEASNNVFKVNNVNSAITAAVARGKITSANSSTLTLRRVSFFDNFKVTELQDLVGLSTSANARIVSVSEYNTDKPAGLNANITANVVTTDGSIQSLLLTDAGFGYEHDEGLEITSLDGLKVASGKATVNGYGVGVGYYKTTSGFLSDDFKVFDGNYYQDYSYEIRSPLPLDKYQNMILEVLHVAGTKLFGKVETESISNVTISIANSSLTLS